jgi:hypothetical protein
MVGAAGAEVKMASHITTLLLANPDPVDGSIKNPNRHTCVLKREHLLEASLLPNGHPVSMPHYRIPTLKIDGRLLTPIVFVGTQDSCRCQRRGIHSQERFSVRE